MSAWFVSDKEINVLASVYHTHYRVEDTTYEATCKLFRDQNIKSLKARYGKFNGTHKIVANLIPEAEWPDTITILKLCDYYDYQSCETSDYKDTKAANLINTIRGDLIGNLPGYSEAPWGLR